MDGWAFIFTLKSNENWENDFEDNVDENEVRQTQKVENLLVLIIVPDWKKPPLYVESYGFLKEALVETEYPLEESTGRIEYTDLGIDIHREIKHKEDFICCGIEPFEKDGREHVFSAGDDISYIYLEGLEVDDTLAEKLVKVLWKLLEDGDCYDEYWDEEDYWDDEDEYEYSYEKYSKERAVEEMKMILEECIPEKVEKINVIISTTL